MNQIIKGYEVKIKDYKYKSKPPISISVSGTILGECNNILGEPCYFYKSANAMSMVEGIEIANKIIENQLLSII